MNWPTTKVRTELTGLDGLKINFFAEDCDRVQFKDGHWQVRVTGEFIPVKEAYADIVTAIAIS